ncbi:MAG: DUF2341 domain-containing protein [Chitinispirillaceae bacterium]|nr:DUF2341 domain-containing protein [Chitinispirillaceae bacterium]
MRNVRMCMLLFFLCGLLVSCANLTGGNGSETTNGYVVGRLVNPDGTPATQTKVRLLPWNYNPVKDGAIPDSQLFTTGETGEFKFHAPGRGAFNIEAIRKVSGERALIAGISVNENDTAFLLAHAIRKPGAIKIIFPPTVDSMHGYVYLPGTTRFAGIKNNNAFIDSVPAELIPAVYYANRIDAAVNGVVKMNIPVASDDTTVIADYQTWKNSKKIILNTTVSGADVASTFTDFPVLIRLYSANFDFSQAQPDGRDLRFKKSDDTPLPYEIERWDATIGLAEVWVKVDTIHGNDSSQFIMMFWGNSNVAEESDAAGVFDTAGGFLGVWHLNEDPSTGTGSIKDRTVNRYHATPYGSMSTADVVDGVVGKGLDLDGSNDYLNAGKVVLTGSYSVGLWVRLNRINGYQRIIFQDSAYTLWYDSDRSGARMEHIDSSKIWRGIPQDGGVVQPMNTGAWYYLTGTFDGERVRFYVNGTLATTSNAMAVNPASHGYDLLFGQSWNNYYVNGIMDEIRIERTARSADWIKLCALNQRSDDKLVVFK